MAILELMKRPSSWISVLAGSLLMWVALGPDAEKSAERTEIVAGPPAEVSATDLTADPSEAAPMEVAKPMVDAKLILTDPNLSLYLPPDPLATPTPPVPVPLAPTEGSQKMVVNAVPMAADSPAPVPANPSPAPATTTEPKVVTGGEIDAMMSPEEIAELLKKVPVAKVVPVALVGPLAPEEMARVQREEFVGPLTAAVMEREWRDSWVGPPQQPEIVGPLTAMEMERVWRAELVGPLTTEEVIAAWNESLMGPPLAGEDPMFAQVMGLSASEAQDRGDDSEFAHDDEELDGKKMAGAGPQKPTARITPPPAAEKAVASTSPKEVPKSEPEPTPPPLSEEPLPPAQGNVWKVVKVDGRDYVTGQSIQMFYRFSTHKVDGKHVWFRTPNLILKAQIGSQELLVNNIKFIMSYPVLSQGGQALFSRLDLCKLIEPVIRPNYISTNSVFDTVVLDAGHGGHDSGAKGIYGYEKNYALAMAFSTREALMKRGFKVLMTRSNDTFLPLSSRVALANKTPNSIFISLHFNSGGSTASGIETFALTPQGSASTLARGGGFSNSARLGNQFDSENIALATAVHAQVVHRFKLLDRGIKRARWTVLTGCNRPGILFEGGFVTNARECQLIASETYRKAVAEAIGDAVVNFKRALSPQAAKR